MGTYRGLLGNAMKLLLQLPTLMGSQHHSLSEGLDITVSVLYTNIEVRRREEASQVATVHI